MKGFNFKEKFTKAKTVYTMAAVSFCLAAIAIAVVYTQTLSKVESIIPDMSTTKQVHQNQTGVSDPREEMTTIKSKKEVTTEAPTTEAVTEEQAEIEESESLNAEPETTAAAATIATKQEFILPHDGEIIRPYSPDVPLHSETMNDWRTHTGIDIAVNEGDEAVSVGKGTVSRVIVDSSFGYTVEVDYGNFTARYCGLKQGESVGLGQSLEKGDSVGIIEAVPCEASDDLHLHFEIIRDGADVDPIKALGA